MKLRKETTRSGTLPGVVARLSADEGGVVLPLVALLIVPLLGLGTLALDVSRYMDLQSQLQKAADAFAIGAGAELDMRPRMGVMADSITRADQAINSLMAGRNNSAWGNPSPVAVTVARRFLTGLPADSVSPIPGTYETSDPDLARFVEVTVTPVQIRTFFPARLLSSTIGSNTMQSSASAVAGMNQSVCKFTPLYICNPFEGQGSIYQAAADPANRRRELVLKEGTATGSKCPGNFGYLDVAGQNGASVVRNSLAAVNPGACYTQNAVSTQTGNIASASDAINVRFDVYTGSASGWKNNSDYPPAYNVRKGYKSKTDCAKPATVPACNDDVCYLSGDFNHTTTACGSQVGNGQWDFDRYWSVNYEKSGGLPPPNAWQCSATACNNPPSRYDVYRYEIDNGLRKVPSVGGETGIPTCSGSTPPDTPPDAPAGGGKPAVRVPDRRTVYGALIDCEALQAAGYSFNGTTENVPVTAFAEFFLTRPVTQETDSRNTIYAELVRLLQPGGADGVAHDLVQLYR